MTNTISFRILATLLITVAASACGEDEVTDEVDTTTEPMATLVTEPMADDAVASNAEESAAAPLDQPCANARDYSLEGESLASITEGVSFLPRVVWTGTEWGAIWQTPREDGLRTLRFQRFSSSGEPLDSSVEIGVTRLAEHRIVYTGAVYLVAWMAERAETDAEPFTGIRMRAINSSGVPAGTPVRVENTFDVQSLDLAWSPTSGGMLVFSRGGSGSPGVFGRTLDSSLNFGDLVDVQLGQTGQVAVIYGEGVWATSWLPVGQPLPELSFVLLDRNGLRGAPKVVPSGAPGGVHLSYGQNYFAAAWTRSGTNADGLAVRRPSLTLFDGLGDVVDTTDIPGPSLSGVARDVAWVGSQGFAVAWEERAADTARLGITRATTQATFPGQIQLMTADGNANYGLQLAVDQGRAEPRISVWTTNDPDHELTGYSASARIQMGVYSACQ